MLSTTLNPVTQLPHPANLQGLSSEETNDLANTFKVEKLWQQFENDKTFWSDLEGQISHFIKKIAPNTVANFTFFFPHYSSNKRDIEHKIEFQISFKNNYQFFDPRKYLPEDVITENFFYPILSRPSPYKLEEMKKVDCADTVSKSFGESFTGNFEWKIHSTADSKFNACITDVAFNIGKLIPSIYTKKTGIAIKSPGFSFFL